MAALDAFADKLLAGSVPVADRLIHIRHYAGELGLSLRDSDLQRKLWEARRRNAGAIEMLKPGMAASVKPETWAWKGLILAGDSTLLASDPKVGKTTLLVDGIARWYRGDAEHLGLAFYGPCPPVIIAGTDMPLGRWLRLLHRFGLAETTGPDCFRLLPDGPIRGLFSMDSPIHLDHDGIARLADLASKHPGCLLIADSYAKLTGPLGLKEASADFAGPLGDLQEAVAPYGTTLVAIHHSGRSRTGEGAVAASRGTTALPAAVSQCVALSWLNRSRGSKDNRVVLQTEGRGGEPMQLLIEQQERGWISHGDAAEVFAEQQAAQAEEGLQDKQAAALDVVRERWEMGRERTTSSVLVDELNMKGGHALRTARRTLQQLLNKGLLQSSKEATNHGQVVWFWPAGGVDDQCHQSFRSPLSEVPPVSPPSPYTAEASTESSDDQREGTHRAQRTGGIDREDRGHPPLPVDTGRVSVIVGGEPGWSIKQGQKLSGRSVAAQDPSGHIRLVDPKDVMPAMSAQAPELATAPTIHGAN
ncbi:AAA family ATPase [Cyanobium sp. FGCU-52]|nr:AAA family ATPase [Cyanobium sp. FGCU52]